jgi:Phosphotransferase enzyme family
MPPETPRTDSYEPSATRLIDANVAGVATADLSAALEDALGQYLGQPRRVVEIQRRPPDYWSSYKVELIDIRLDDGSVLPLFFKQLGRRGLVEAAAGIKPPFLDNPLREIEIYRGILNPLRLGTPVCYGALIDPAGDRYWLFLERVSGSMLSQEVEVALWRQAAQWLAGFHASLAGVAENWRRAGRLLNHDAAYFRIWPRRAKTFLGFSSQSTSEQRRQIGWLATRYERVVDALISLPRTVIHGEYYASNVLVHKEGGQVRVCPVDWEMAAVGPGLIDLAALTAGRWTDTERAALCDAYRTALPPGSEWDSKPDALRTMLDHCRIHLAVQWLGWSRSWVAPQEHRRDWLSEAVVLAESLGL